MTEYELSHRHASPAATSWGQIAMYAAFAGVPVLVASVLGGAVTGPQIPGWYASLVKPPHNPPNWVFGPVWTILYAMMAYAAFRLWRLPEGTPGRATALVAFYVNIAINLAWSVVFFGLQSPLGGLFVIAVLLVSIVDCIRRFAPLDRVSAWLFAPYLAWVAYASTVNFGVWWLN